MAHTPRPYRGPLLAGLALFAASGGWAWLYWGTIHERELDQLDRLSGNLGAAIEIVLDREGTTEVDDGRLERWLREKLEVRRPLIYALVLQGDRRIATLGEVPSSLADPRAPGLSPGHDLIIFRHPLGAGRPPRPEGDGPPRDQPRPPRDDARPRPDGRRHPPDRPGAGSPWHWRSQVAAERIEVVVGCDTTLPRRVYEKNLPELAFALAVGWSGIAALVLAWYRSIRSRDLARALDAERRERTRLEELNLAAAGLAHETKNPLGIILGLAQRVARDPAIGPETREAAEQIVDAADQAAARLSDFLGFARVSAPRLEPTRADALLQRVVTALQADFDDAGVRVAVTAPPLCISCAPAMVEQVLVNLALNSLQASEPGTQVTLRLDARGPRASLVVEDHGRGIPAALLPEVFKPYVTGRADGHGLGLAIVKRIVDQHGWSITIDSVVAGGTRVTISDILVTGPAEASP